MDKFNLQFATQRLREEEDSELQIWIDKISDDGGKTWNQKIIGNDGIIWKQEKVFKDKDNNITGYNYVPYYKGYNISTGGFNFGSIKSFAQIIKDYIVSNQLYNKLKSEPEKPLDEESVTGTGAGMTASTVNNPVTQDWYTTKKTPKKEGANIPKDFTDAPSIPNRPSKGGFIYKKIFEELSKALKEVSVGDFNYYRSDLKDAYGDLVRAKNPDAKVVGSAYDSLNIENNPESISKLDAAKAAIDASNLSDQQKAYYEKAINGIKRYLSQPNQKNGSAINEELGDYFIKISLSDIPEVIEIIKDLYRDSLKQGIINLDKETDVVYVYDKDTAQDLLSVFEDDQIEVVSHNVPLEDEEDDFYDEFDDEPVNDYGLNQKYPGSYEKEYQKTGKTDFSWRHGGLEEIKLDLDLTDRTLERLIMLLKGHMNTERNLIASLEKALGREVDPFPHLKESYSRFKNETKTRGKSDQFHQAIREVKKKVLEINKMYEYVSRLKEELSEGGNALEYKIHTEKALHKIKEMVSELNKKIKRFK